MAITDWPDDERPRERLHKLGAAALSNAELLAIFLRVGVRGKSAVDLARELLAQFDGDLALLAAAPLTELTKNLRHRSSQSQPTRGDPRTGAPGIERRNGPARRARIAGIRAPMAAPEAGNIGP